MEDTNNNDDGRELLRERILSTATAQFMSKGIKAVKMDDIAKTLTISKRTLYEVFCNKEELLLASVQKMQRDETTYINHFINSGSHNVLEIVLEFYYHRLKELNGVSPLYYSQLGKYPEVTEWIKEQKEEHEAEVKRFFQHGIDEGLFRSDVNYKLIDRVCIDGMEYAMRTQAFKEYSLQEIFRDVTMLYIRGFCTLKGIEVLEEISSHPHST